MPVKNPQPFKKFFIEIAINYMSLAPIPKDTAEKSKKDTILPKKQKAFSPKKRSFRLIAAE